MRVLAIENYPKTTLGLLGAALDLAGAESCVVRAHQGEPVPDSPDGYDALVLLGGAQSALDDAAHPYMRQELRLARDFGEADKPVLGVCLGAQLLARAYGARNILGRPIEFGWREVRPSPEGRADPLISTLGAGKPVFHWHLDTFTLPPRAVRLAESDMTEIQAFRIGRATYGVQFHFEAGTELVAAWTRDFGDELAEVAPDWPARRAAETASHGAAADAAGLAIGAAWIGLIR